jgi:hypothetical protein
MLINKTLPTCKKKSGRKNHYLALVHVAKKGERPLNILVHSKIIQSVRINLSRRKHTLTLSENQENESL